MMSNPWAIAAIIEGIIILTAIWVGSRFAVSHWQEKKKGEIKEKAAEEYWPFVTAEVTHVKIPRPLFMKRYKVVAEYYSVDRGENHTFEEAHHFPKGSSNPTVKEGDRITVRVNFPSRPDQ